MHQSISLLILFLTLSSLSLSTTNGQKLKCNNKTQKEMDMIVARIMTFGTDRPFPKDKAELRDYCKEQTRLVQKLENYKTSCLKNQAKSIVAVIIYSIKQVTNTYCKRPNSRRSSELLDSASCANAATNDYNKCSIEYIERLLYAKTLGQSKDRLIQSCCGYFAIYNCVRQQAAKHPEQCTDERIDANINYIRTFFDNAINAACGEYSGDNDKCDKVTVPPPKKSNKKSLPASFFNPLVNLLSNL
uniref:Uncharacterized protein LOC113788766 n=1 Tax=Dermatophagoides pteronyssinus TaxID=6956 RepID=A0A6P6XKI3_DERPT|nr:uncharacterized protein LOC113788766 [Dermatophagoides pteronyssinus]